MKSTSLQLSVAEPCHQSWDDMNTDGSNKFCTHCQKTVTDFTRMTDAALLAYVQQHGLGCGRFRQDQMSRMIAPVTVPRKKWWAYLTFSAGLLLGATWKSRALPPVIVLTDAGARESPADTGTITLSGRVITGHRKTPVQHAIVRADDAAIHTTTDTNGYFSLQIPEQAISNDLIIYVLHEPMEKYIVTSYKWQDILEMKEKVFILEEEAVPLATPGLTGRATGTIYVIDGVVVKPGSPFDINSIRKRKSFWRKLQFWK